MSDVTYKEAVSIADLPVTNLIHAPCPDMDGCKDFDPEKTERARFLISKLREKHGIKRRVKPQSNPMTYTCTEAGCIEPWGTVSNGEPY